jgi:hypothetical protein
MLITGILEKNPASRVHSVDFKDNYDWKLPTTTPLHIYALKMETNNITFK